MISSSGGTTIRVAASAETIRSILADADALGRILPGCESCEAVEEPDGPSPGAGSRRFRIVLSTRVGFLTVRADVDATLLEPAPPRLLRLDLDGRTRGFEGGFTASIPFELRPDGDDATSVRYEVAVATRGTVAMAGDAAVAGAIHELADELVVALEREASGR